MKISGADIVIETLKELGVDTIFGYPGGAVLPIYDALCKIGGLRHILVRHEQGAIHAAQAYSRTTGKMGVVLVTSGPGATNIVTGIADAFMDSTPVVAITGQVPTYMIGTDAFQEIDITSITRQITKHNYLITNTEDINQTFKEAFYLAGSGRKGPVLIDIPKDIQNRVIDYKPAVLNFRFPDKFSNLFKPEDLSKSADLIKNAKKPVIYVGGGLKLNNKNIQELYKFAKKLNFPVVSTSMGLGAYPSSESNYLGLAGMHGLYESNMAIYEADLLIGIGVRFNDRVTQIFKEYSPNSKKIHIDIDSSSINKNVPIDVSLVGEAGDVLESLVLQVEAGDISQWWSQINEWKKTNCLAYDIKDGSFIKPQYALEILSKKLENKNPVITTDVGQHQMWAAQYFKFQKPDEFISSLGLGTMGFGLPAAIGAKVGNPNREVICITGDGSIIMNIQELATAMQFNIAAKVVVLNNNYLGMVKQWQDIFYENRYSESEISSYTDFTKIAASFGLQTYRATTYADLEIGINKMLESSSPFLLDVIISKDETVYSTNLIPHPKNITQNFKTFLISTFAYNEKGVLARICNMLTSSMYNIEDLSAGELEDNLSYVNVVITGSDRLINALRGAIYKMVPVTSVEVTEIEPGDFAKKQSYFIKQDNLIKHIFSDKEPQGTILRCVRYGSFIKL